MLNIKCLSPYKVFFRGVEVEFSAYIPSFGSKAGQLIMEVREPDFVVSDIHRMAGEDMKIPVSFVNPDSMTTVEEFVEALRDWGFSESTDRPSFL
jgi:hypothetical protein